MHNNRNLGMILGLIAVVALMELVGVLRGRWTYLWPSLLTLLAIITIVLNFSYFARQNRSVDVHSSLFSDLKWLPWLMAVAGLSEIGSLVTGWSFLKLAWPLVLLYLGYQFRVGEDRERLIGGTLLFAGSARALAIVSGIYKGTVGIAWIALIIFAAFLLMTKQAPARNGQE